MISDYSILIPWQELPSKIFISEPAGCWEYNRATWAQGIKCYNPNISQEPNMYIRGQYNFWLLPVKADLGPSELNMIGYVSIPKALQSNLLNC